MCHSSIRKFCNPNCPSPQNDDKLILWQVWCELVMVVVAVQLLAYTRPNIVSFISWRWSRHQAPVTGWKKLTPGSTKFLTHSTPNSRRVFLCMNCILNWRAEMIMHVPIYHPIMLVVELRWRWSLFDNGVQNSMSPSKLWAPRYTEARLFINFPNSSCVWSWRLMTKSLHNWTWCLPGESSYGWTEVWLVSWPQLKTRLFMIIIIRLPYFFKIG